MGPVNPNPKDLNDLLALARERTMPSGEGSSFQQGDCLSSLEIGQLAGMVMEASRAQVALQHVAGCEDCGRRLREAKEDFDRPLDADEERMLGQVKDAPAGLTMPDTRRGRRQSGMVWALAAAAMILVTAGVWWLTGRSPARRLETGLQAAYRAGRPFDFRLDLPGYGPQRQQKGREGEPYPELSAIVKQSQIASTAVKDVAMARLVALSDTLNGRNHSALEILEHARSLDPGNEAIAVELGTAYALRGDENRSAEDYGRALDLLGTSHSSALRPIALFNLAIVYERLGMYQQAIDQWQAFLRLKPEKDWRDEAEAKLRELESKKKSAR